MAARKEDDFSLFAPKLRNLLDLLKQKAAAIDPDRHPYDVLLDEFDLGASSFELSKQSAEIARAAGRPRTAARGTGPRPARSSALTKNR